MGTESAGAQSAMRTLEALGGPGGAPELYKALGDSALDGLPEVIQEAGTLVADSVYGFQSS